MLAGSGASPVDCFRQLSAFVTEKDVLWMPCIACHKVAGEQINCGTACAAGYGFNPQKILNMGLLIVAKNTARTVQLSYFLFQLAA